MSTFRQCQRHKALEDVRQDVDLLCYVAEHGRAPIDAAELAGQIAKSSRPRAQTVAGYDLTFSPVKS